MKKTFVFAVVSVLLLACLFSFTACNDSKLVGVYEMIDIEGTITIDGQTTYLNTDLYEFYTIELKKGGKAVVKSKASGSAGQYIENTATWTYDEGILKLKTSQGGMSVIEEMTLEDDIITFVSVQSAEGVAVNMTVTFKKQS